MNAGKKKALVFAISFLLALALTYVAWLAGYLTASADTLAWNILACIIGGIVIAVMVVNLCMAGAFKKKMNAMDMRAGYEWSKQVQKEIERDYRRAEKAVFRLLAVGYVYAVTVLALLLLFLFCIGRGHNNAAIVSAIAGIFLLSGIINALLMPGDSPMPENGLLLDEKKYPLLRETAFRAAKAVGYTGGILLFLSSDGISINQYRGNALVFLNPVEVNLLTREELYTVFLHEFGHIVNIDISRFHRFSKAAATWGDTTNMGFLGGLFLSAFGQKIMLSIALYDLLASRYHEIRADEVVAKFGDAQTYINATSKADMYLRFQQMPQRELSYDIYENEQPPKDLLTKELETFCAYREKYRDRWLEQMKKELPARVSSHPTFRMRMENAGVAAFDDLTRETDGAYIAEQKAFLAEGDKQLCEVIKENYGEYRKQMYQERKEQMERYDAAKAAGEELSNDELMRSMKAFYGIDDGKVREIAEGMLQKDPDAAFGHYYLGGLLYDADDPACVEHFYAAAKSNRNLAEECMDCVGRFALKTGDAELLERYRSDVADIVQKAIEEGQQTVWNKKTVLRECSLPKEKKDEIVEKIRSLCSDEVTAIYLASFGEGNEQCHMVLLEYAKGVSGEKQYEVYQKTYAYLDCIGQEDFTLYDSHFRRELKAMQRDPQFKVYSKT